MATSPLALDHIVIPKVRGNKILDVGCGYGKWGFLSKKYFWTSRNGNAREQPFVVGIDVHLPNITCLTTHRIYDHLICGDAAHLPFEDRSFDTVLALEVIEHLEEAKGYQALRELERIATKCIILSTPNKKCLRDGSDDFLGHNSHEAHLSWWKMRTFNSLGYRCYGIGVKWEPRKFWSIAEFTFLSYRFPLISETLLCVKTLE